MSWRVFFAVAMLLCMSNPVLADVGPSFGTPDFGKSSAAGNAFFGVSLAALLSFGGYWCLRNPRAGLASILFIGGIGVFLLSILFLPLFGPPVFVLSAVGALMVLLGCKRAFVSRAPFVGRNLVFLLLALVAMGATVISLGQLEWTNPRQERNRLRQQHQNELRERESKEGETKDKKPSESKPPATGEKVKPTP